MTFRAAREELNQVRGSFRIIFGNRPDNPGIVWMFSLINALIAALEQPHPEKLLHCPEAVPDALDLLNEAADRLLENPLDQLIFERFNHIPHDRFFIEHAACAATLPQAIHRLAVTLNSYTVPHVLSRLRPEWLAGVPHTLVKASMSGEELNSAIAQHDPFGAGRTLKYLNSAFIPVRPQNWRKMEDFYGFHNVRDIFNEHFKSFAAGNPAPPLFITSLPGLGKTAMTIAATLGNPELTLVIAEPKALENGLEEMFGTLGTYPRRRFVVFFDDIDPAVRERRGLEYYTPLKVWMKQPPSASAADSSSRAGRATPDGAPGWPASCPSTPPPRTTCATPSGPATRESSTRWRDG